MDTPDSPTDTRLDRRRLLQLGAAAAAAPTVAGVLAERARATSASHQQLEEMTIAQMQAELHVRKTDFAQAHQAVPRPDPGHRSERSEAETRS